MSSSAMCTPTLPLTIAAMEYADVGPKMAAERQMLPAALLPVTPQHKKSVEVVLSEEELTARLIQERTDAMAQTEQRVRSEYEARLEKLRDTVTDAVARFDAQRSDYFARVETEVVQLSLSIAAKILHREAQIDPMLIAAIAKITIERMREGESVTLRVGTGRAKSWQECFVNQAATVRILEDPSMTDSDCVLETEFGTTHLGFEHQLKEVEQGFFDLLALRPD